MGAVERFERQLRERLKDAPPLARGGILREAVDLARPLVALGQLSRTRAISTIHAIGREHDIKTLKSASPAKGLFAGPPFHNGPEAA
jgi:hypothetical protein